MIKIEKNKKTTMNNSNENTSWESSSDSNNSEDTWCRQWLITSLGNHFKEIIYGNEPSNEDDNEMCEVHSKIGWIFWTTCNKVLCTSCLCSLSHKSHKYAEFKDILQEKRLKVGKMHQDLLSLNSDLENEILIVKELSTFQELKMESLSEQINNIINDVKESCKGELKTSKDSIKSINEIWKNLNDQVIMQKEGWSKHSLNITQIDKLIDSNKRLKEDKVSQFYLIRENMNNRKSVSYLKIAKYSLKHKLSCLSDFKDVYQKLKVEENTNLTISIIRDGSNRRLFKILVKRGDCGSNTYLLNFKMKDSDSDVFLVQPNKVSFITKELAMVNEIVLSKEDKVSINLELSIYKINDTRYKENMTRIKNSLISAINKI